MGILIVIPTYNEKDNINHLVEEIEGLGISLPILVIDDNSADKTQEEVKALQAKHKNIYLIERPAKLGLGSAYRQGFRYALDNNYEAIVQMDADLSHSPSYIIPMLSLLGEYDVVIGSRYIKGGGIEEWGFLRRILSYGANKVSRCLLGMPFFDLTSGFKCIKREALEKIDFSTIKSQGYAFQLEVIYRAWKKRVKIVEYPIIFKGRKKEKSKMSLLIIGEAIFIVLSLFMKRLCRMFQ